MKIKKYAWIPCIAQTWSSNTDHAVIWLQSYSTDKTGYKTIGHIGFFGFRILHPKTIWFRMFG